MHRKRATDCFKYIAFEGIDASGKSTQAKMLINFLKNEGYDVFLTKEPGGTKEGEAIRNLLLSVDLPSKARTFMFLADRVLHIEKVSKLLKTSYVISDRSLFSTIAYQAFGEGLDLDFIERASLFSASNIVPDITFVMDIDTSTIENRIKKMDVIESKGKSFFDRVKKGYEYIAKHYKNVYIIDGEQPADRVFEDILKIWNKI